MKNNEVFTRKEYIEREAAIIAIKNLYPGIPLAKIRLQKWHDENKNFMECELAIERIPAADVAPVRHGRWTSVFDIGTVCNQCGYDIEQHGFDVRTDGEPNYCPNCGAKMDMEAEEGE